MNAHNSILDVRLDRKCFTASFSHEGVKWIVENKSQNILPKSRGEVKAGFSLIIRKILLVLLLPIIPIKIIIGLTEAKYFRYMTVISMQ